MQIAKKIPIPQQNSSNKRWVDILEELQINNSVLLRDAKEANAMRTAANKLKIPITQRAEKNGKVRVWRVLDLTKETK